MAEATREVYTLKLREPRGAAGGGPRFHSHAQAGGSGRAHANAPAERPRGRDRRCSFMRSSHSTSTGTPRLLSAQEGFMKAKQISKKKTASKATAVTKRARTKGTRKKATRKSKPATTPVGDIMRNAAG